LNRIVDKRFDFFNNCFYKLVIYETVSYHPSYFHMRQKMTEA